MAINRYDSPAEAQFIDTYVPIPFEKLYTLGKQAKEEVDKALADASAAFKEWGEFQSLSQKDIQTFYDETKGKALPVVNDLIKNPDKIKTVEGRMALQSVINNVNSAKLSALRQSAENMAAYDKLTKKLMMKGLYNPDWHYRDFTNYDSTQGMFNETPIAYMDLNELSKPYMDQIKKGYIETSPDGLWDYYGNTKEDIEAVANAHLTDMINTPQGQMHIKMYMKNNPNLTYENAVNKFREAVVSSNMDITRRPTRVANEYAKLAMAARYSKSGKSGSDTESMPQTRVGEIRASIGNKKIALLAGIRGEDANSYTQEQGNQLKDAYSEIWRSALSEGDTKKMKALMDFNSARIGEEARYMIEPLYDPKNANTIKIGDGTPNKTQTVGKGLMYGAVAFNNNGIPVSEIPREFLLNNDKKLLNAIGGKWSMNSAEGKFKDLLKDYGNIINDVLTSADYQFIPDGTVMEYDRLSNESYPYSKSMLVKGKAYISEDELDAVIEANKGRYGNLSKGDIKTILFGDGISGKHVIGSKKEDVKFNDEEKGRTYYELNVGIPFDENAKVKSFDDIRSSDVFGGTNSFKQHPTHLNVAFDSDLKNSTL